MITFEAFRQSCLDLSVLGLQDMPSKKSPVAHKAKVLAWLVNSSVYFCQYPDHGETVFAVDPNALPEEQNIPVAEDIQMFIGLLVACRDATLIANAYRWSSLRLQEQLDSVAPGMKAESVLRALNNIYHPASIHNPGELMLQLRQEYITSTKSVLPVSFDADFNQSSGQGSEELSISQSLDSEYGTWNVPSIFLCEEGIVVDTYLEVPVNAIISFRQKWGCRSEEVLSIGDQMQRDLDDPLTTAISGVLTVNDKPLRCKSCFNAVWNPLDDNLDEVRRLLNHYRLDPDHGYLFKRYSFSKKGKYPLIRTMHLTLEALPVPVPSETFNVHKDGQRFRFHHPVTGLEHIFTAVALTNEALNPNFLTNHPCFYSRLNYTLEPSISPENFQIVDRYPSDYWQDYQENPASVIYADQKADPGRYALSSLHYEPQDKVHWQIIFRRKLHKDLHLKLLP